MITFVLADGRTRDTELIAVLARHLCRLLGRRLAGIVADCGFTNHASIAALAATKIPFILGFARTRPVKAALAAIPPSSAGGWPGRRDRPGRLCLAGGPAPARPRRPYPDGPARPLGLRHPLWGSGPQTLIRLYRQRWRVEQAIDELLHGHDLDHLVGSRLHPNRVAIGLRLLARNLAIGRQIRAAGARPEQIREPLAFRAAQVEGLGIIRTDHQTIVVTPLCVPADEHDLGLPWAACHVRCAA